MKNITTTTLLSLITLVACSDLRQVDYELGPQRFRDGDSIKIEAVKAASSDFKVGDIITVKGVYTLQSRKEAKLLISVTQTKSDGRSNLSPNQQIQVQEGKGDFELTIQIQHEGFLHISLYPKAGGPAFGGVYFGKPEAMKQIEYWTLDSYLADWSDFLIP